METTNNQVVQINPEDCQVIAKKASFTLEGSDFNCYLMEPSGEIMYDHPEDDCLIDCYQLADFLMSTIYSSDDSSEGETRLTMITTLVTMQLDALARAVLDTVD